MRFNLMDALWAERNDVFQVENPTRTSDPRGMFHQALPRMEFLTALKTCGAVDTSPGWVHIPMAASVMR